MAAGTLTFKMEEGDPHAPVSQAIESMRPLFEKKGLKLAFERSVEKRTAYFDTRRVEQVVSNLLNNALKYTPKGGKVSVAMSDVDYSGGQEYIKISVSDNGSGIPPGLRDKIFDRFKLMGSQEIREADGLGLGLPLSKFIVENLGGKIWAESEEGKGTTFHFTIPCFRKEALES
ncbi:MAG: ATP-binding protein [Acidobacteriota bacterium]